MPKKTYKLFIFDFDGTIADTKECIIASFNKTFTTNGFPAVSWEEIVKRMGLPLEENFISMISQKLDEKMLAKLTADYRAFYKEVIAEKTRLFPQALQTLKKLKAKGILCSVATSKQTEAVTYNLKHLEIESYFDLIMGNDLVTQKKPHPEMLEKTLKKLKIATKDAVMVGDSTFDLAMGNAAHMDTIAVSWGAHSLEELQTENPTYIVHKFSELLEFAGKS